MCMGTEGMEEGNFNSDDFSSRMSDTDSLLCRGLFVLWGGWGEKKRESAGHDGKEKERRKAPTLSLFPSSPALSIFFDYCYFYRDTQREPLRRRE